MLMHDICRFNALKNPGGDALVFETEARRTWAQLEARVETIANFLANAGIRKGDRVCFLAKNCIEAMEVFLASNRIGALYAPVNYRFAVPEIMQVVQDSRPKIFVAHREFADQLREVRDSGAAGFISAWFVIGAEGTGIDDFEAALHDQKPRDYFPKIEESDVSWICYTGGTTGRPKGVLLTHRNMMAGAINFIVTAHIQPHDTYFVAGALFHIALAVPIAYWLVGCKVVLANFPNPSGMRQLGNSSWAATGLAGEVVLGSPGEKGLGSLMSSMLEGSNVDMTEELVGLIAAQRAFQANAKALDTSSQISQSILNIRA